MHAGDTTLGGPAKEFMKTAWDLLSRARDSSAETRKAALDELCRIYWKPIYSHLRIVWGKANEDAKDLTQAFLLWLVEGDALKKYAPERASFRTYLKLLLKHFVHDHEDALHRLKRGGGVHLFDLDGEDGRLGELQDDRQGADPERVFDQVWTMELVQRSVLRVGERFRSAGKSVQFQVFEEYDGRGTGESPTYAALAARLGLKESDVRNYLFAVREEVRSEIRAELAAMTRSPEELEEEWNALFRF